MITGASGALDAVIVVNNIPNNATTSDVASATRIFIRFLPHPTGEHDTRSLSAQLAFHRRACCTGPLANLPNCCHSATDRANMASYLGVCSDDDMLRAVVSEFTAAGWTTQTLHGPFESADDGPSGPGAPAPPNLLFVASIHRAEHTTGVLDLLVAGHAVVVRRHDEPTGADLYDQARRLGRAEWFDRRSPPCCHGLTDEQIALLVCVGTGLDVATAARECNVSLRTAGRRLADARTTLGARTTGEAASRVRRRIGELRTQ